MQIVFHLGAHCTDDERILRCLLKNRGILAEQGVAVPGPTRYRNLLRETALRLQGAPASAETQAMLIEQILEGTEARRVVFSWDSFLGYAPWAMKGRLYPAAAERVRAYRAIFPDHEVAFAIGLRNPATFLQALLQKQDQTSYEGFLDGADPLELKWSDMLADMRAAVPDFECAVWCDEDTPLVFPDVLQVLTGHDEQTRLKDDDELLAAILSREGITSLRAALGPGPVARDRRIAVVLDHLDRFALAEKTEMEFDLPGWSAEALDWMTAAYDRDTARIAGMPGVHFFAP